MEMLSPWSLNTLMMASLSFPVCLDEDEVIPSLSSLFSSGLKLDRDHSLLLLSDTGVLYPPLQGTVQQGWGSGRIECVYIKVDKLVDKKNWTKQFF